MSQRPPPLAMSHPPFGLRYRNPNPLALRYRRVGLSLSKPCNVRGGTSTSSVRTGFGCDSQALRYLRANGPYWEVAQ